MLSTRHREVRCWQWCAQYLSAVHTYKHTLLLLLLRVHPQLTCINNAAGLIAESALKPFWSARAKGVRERDIRIAFAPRAPYLSISNSHQPSADWLSESKHAESGTEVLMGAAGAAPEPCRDTERGASRAGMNLARARADRLQQLKSFS